MRLTPSLALNWVSNKNEKSLKGLDTDGFYGTDTDTSTGHSTGLCSATITYDESRIFDCQGSASKSTRVVEFDDVPQSIMNKPHSKIDGSVKVMKTGVRVQWTLPLNKELLQLGNGLEPHRLGHGARLWDAWRASQDVKNVPNSKAALQKQYRVLSKGKPGTVRKHLPIFAVGTLDAFMRPSQGSDQSKSTNIPHTVGEVEGHPARDVQLTRKRRRLNAEIVEQDEDSEVRTFTLSYSEEADGVEGNAIADQPLVEGMLGAPEPVDTHDIERIERMTTNELEDEENPTASAVGEEVLPEREAEAPEREAPLDGNPINAEDNDEADTVVSDLTAEEKGSSGTSKLRESPHLVNLSAGKGTVIRMTSWKRVPAFSRNTGSQQPAQRSTSRWEHML